MSGACTTPVAVTVDRSKAFPPTEDLFALFVERKMDTPRRECGGCSEQNIWENCDWGTS